MEMRQLYKCGKCGNIVMVMHASGGKLICCGQPMDLLKENSVDAAQEKHVPVIEKTASGVKVKVGSVPHPMEEKHSIEWIELIADDRSCIQFLKPGEPAEAVFDVQASSIAARGYCNLHGLWKSN